MNEEALNILNRITSTEPESLGGEHIAFLKARRDYLTEEQKTKYAGILGEPAEIPKEPKPKVKKPAKKK